MEEKQEPKKKKILKLIKTIGFIILGGLLIIMLCGTCKKTNALSTYNNYGYQYIGEISSKTNLGNDYYQCNFTMYSYYSNGEWKQGSNSDLSGYEIYIQKNLSYEDGLGISQANVNNNNMYMVKGTFDSGSFYKIYSITTISIYNTKLTTDIYNNGYDAAVNDNSEGNVDGAYEQGKQAGIDSVQQDYNNALNTINGNYQQALDGKDAEIEYYKDIAEGRTTTWGSFKSLLGLIITYPIQIFKEGLNVNLFGVNIGNFILGIGILLILFSILSFIFGGRIGGNKE